MRRSSGDPAGVVVVEDAGERRQLGTVRGEGKVMLRLLLLVVVLVVGVEVDRVARVDSVAVVDVVGQKRE